MVIPYEKVNLKYHKKIEVLHLAKIFELHLKTRLLWDSAVISSSYLRSSGNLPELESKKAIKVEYHDLQDSFSLARFTEKGELSGYDFKVGVYNDYDVAYLIGRDWVGDELTLFASKSADKFEVF